MNRIPSRLALVGLALAIALLYLWTAVPERTPGLVAAREDGYYNLLVKGMLRGHLYLYTRADPFLASLPNPWDPAARQGHGASDASYYHGRYYIYFGVTPALILFLPFKALTGSFISERLACVLFAALGFFLSAWLLRAVQKRYFPGASTGVMLACVLALGAADMMPELLRRPGFREVPIVCGYACAMAVLAALFQALHSRRPGLWLAAASAAFGLAVGSRPPFLLVGPVLLLPLWLDARQRALDRACWADRRWRALLLATVTPALLIGLGLAAYNYARFGDPFQFGLRYQLLNVDPSKTPYFSARFLAFNFHAYWLAPAGWSRFFPFVTVVGRLPALPPGHYGVEDTYGILPNMPFALLALGALGLVGRSFAPRLRLLSGAVLFIAATLTLTLLAFWCALNRYMVDFTPWVMLAAGLGALALTSRPWCRGPAGAAAKAAVLGLAACSAAFNVLASLRHDELLRLEHPALYDGLARSANRITDAYDRLRRTPYGPVEMTVVFPRDKAGALEPLVVTGRTFLSDYLFVQYLDHDSLRFGLEHTSRGTLYGEPMSVTPSQPHVLRIDLGSLYPPPAHPYFGRMTAAEAALRQNTARVTLDGTVAFFRPFAPYEAQSADASIGSSGDRPGFSQPFSGRILSWKRLGSAPVWPPEAPAALRYELRLPAFTGVRSEPLLGTGEPGRGDLVFVRYDSANHVSFGYDHFGGIPLTGPSFVVDPAPAQILEIGFAPLPSKPGVSRLTVRLNGRTALAFAAPRHPFEPADLSPGLNAIASPNSEARFTGDFLALSADATPPPPPSSGMLRLTLKLPAFSGAHNEPLLCTGETGHGDLIYLRYEAANRVSFGLDHWGWGGPSSSSLPIDSSREQIVEIDFPALRPAAAQAPTSPQGARGHLIVRLNGRAALDGLVYYHPCDPATAAVGLNPIQTSTAVPAFSGEILREEWRR